MWYFVSEKYNKYSSCMKQSDIMYPHGLYSSIIPICMPKQENPAFVYTYIKTSPIKDLGAHEICKD